MKIKRKQQDGCPFLTPPPPFPCVFLFPEQTLPFGFRPQIGIPGIIASKRCNNVDIYDNEVYNGGAEAAGIFLHRSSDSAKVYSESFFAIICKTFTRRTGNDLNDLLIGPPPPADRITRCAGYICIDRSCRSFGSHPSNPIQSHPIQIRLSSNTWPVPYRGS